MPTSKYYNNSPDNDRLSPLVMVERAASSRRPRHSLTMLSEYPEFPELRDSLLIKNPAPHDPLEPFNLFAYNKIEAVPSKIFVSTYAIAKKNSVGRNILYCRRVSEINIKQLDNIVTISDTDIYKDLNDKFWEIIHQDRDSQLRGLFKNTILKSVAAYTSLLSVLLHLSYLGVQMKSTHGHDNARPSSRKDLHKAISTSFENLFQGLKTKDQVVRIGIVFIKSFCEVASQQEDEFGIAVQELEDCAASSESYLRYSAGNVFGSPELHHDLQYGQHASSNRAAPSKSSSFLPSNGNNGHRNTRFSRLSLAMSGFSRMPTVAMPPDHQPNPSFCHSASTASDTAKQEGGGPAAPTAPSAAPNVLANPPSSSSLCSDYSRLINKRRVFHRSANNIASMGSPGPTTGSTFYINNAPAQQQKMRSSGSQLNENLYRDASQPQPYPTPSQSFYGTALFRMPENLDIYLPPEQFMQKFPFSPPDIQYSIGLLYVRLLQLLYKKKKRSIFQISIHEVCPELCNKYFSSGSQPHLHHQSSSSGKRKGFIDRILALLGISTA